MEQRATAPNQAEQVSELLREAEFMASPATHDHYEQAIGERPRPISTSVVGQAALDVVQNPNLGSDAEKNRRVAQIGHLMKAYRQEALAKGLPTLSSAEASGQNDLTLAA